jgi:hypothetical protein
MKRYVNFMSNPDERTAIDQFGKGDKCFGVAAMMATLPGLPMFGHGQLEGYTEKYGMEYQRPRYDESPDRWLIERHEREIAPLLKRRWLFAESYNFLLYDFFTDSGHVDENVFAYSNHVGIERALVVYNNVYGETEGTIRISAAYADKGSGRLRQRSLWEGLGIEHGESIVFYRDSLTGLEYLRRASELGERGLRLRLHAYQSYVFLDWQELRATAEKPWDRLCDYLNGRGVPNLDDALADFELRPVHDAFRALLEPATVSLLGDIAELPHVTGVAPHKVSGKAQSAFFTRVDARCLELLKASVAAHARFTGTTPSVLATHPESFLPAFRKQLRDAAKLPSLEPLFATPWNASARRALPNANPHLPATALWGPVLAWCALQLLAESIDSAKSSQLALDLFDRLRLRGPLAHAFSALGFSSEDGWRAAARIKVLLLVEAGIGKKTVPARPEKAAEAESAKLRTAAEALASEATGAVPGPSADPAPAAGLQAGLPIPVKLWTDPDVRWLTGAHEAEGHTYAIRESCEELFWWLSLPELLKLAAAPVQSRTEAAAIGAKVAEALTKIEAAGYRIDALLAPEPATTADPKSLVPQEPVAAKPATPVNPEDSPEDF